MLPPTGTYKNHGDYVSRVAMLTDEALASLVHSQVIEAADAGALYSCVVSRKAMTAVGK